MALPTLAELTVQSSGLDEPRLTPPSLIKPGGVDPLGLRQINFDLMDQVFPGLNNVARHIRPFVLVTWAWRRGRHIAETLGMDQVPPEELKDFVDRMEVIYAWSQLLRDPDVDLPGRRVLRTIVGSEKWTFGGAAWRRRRDERRYSTAFTAPITYGPALKSMGWVEPHVEFRDVMIPTTLVQPALGAFEAQLADFLDHPAFSRFGSVEVTRQEATAWAEAWRLDKPTKEEQDVTRQLLLGSRASSARQDGCALMLAAASHASSRDVGVVRATMAGSQSEFSPAAELGKTAIAWRRVQVRQLFRLSLEALFYWIIDEIGSSSRTTDALVEAFFATCPSDASQGTVRQWLDETVATDKGPTMLIDSIGTALYEEEYTHLASRIFNSLSFCLNEAPDKAQFFERDDRLPLSRARRESEAWSNTTMRAFFGHVIESWVIAQHVFWSVGRGLADARTRGKSILRLRIVLEEGGWSLTPGATNGSPPVATPDRLQTALSLATECGLLQPLGELDGM